MQTDLEEKTLDHNIFMQIGDGRVEDPHRFEME